MLQVLQEVKQTKRYGAEEETAQSFQARIWFVSHILTFGCLLPFFPLPLANSVPPSNLKIAILDRFTLSVISQQTAL